MHDPYQKDSSLNVLGSQLASCSEDPKTGYFRNGYCDTCAQDHGSHTVCAVMTDTFLTFSSARGNDLSTPRPEFNFPGLKPGDQWCLCAGRWQEALEANAAPKINLLATHQRALEIVAIEDLKRHAIDLH